MGASSLKKEFAPVGAYSFIQELATFGRTITSREAESQKTERIVPQCKVVEKKTWRYSHAY